MADATPSATVLVAAGTYTVAYLPDSRIWLREGVSLYGGYGANFSARDTTLYTSTIEDRSNFAASAVNPDFAIISDGAISRATVIDGFTINSSTQSGAYYTAAIRMRNGASPTVQNNTINGGGGHSDSYGIYVDASSPTIQNNIIHGGGAGSRSYGVFNGQGANPAVRSNIIHGGSGVNGSVGIGNINSSPTIQNNTIHGGVGNSARGIFSSGSVGQPASPRIENNIICARSTDACVFCGNVRRCLSTIAIPQSVLAMPMAITRARWQR